MKAASRWAALVAALAPLAGAQARTEAWPQWLGPTQNGTAVDPGRFAGKATVALERLWSRPLETGHAALAVGGGRVYTLFSDGSDEYAVALLADTGAEAWRVKLEPDLLRTFLAGPLTIPALDGDRAFTLSSRCGLRAHDAKSGRELWRVDLKERFGTAVPPGCGPAPVADGGRLILQTGGKPEQRVVALDPGSGDLVWASAGGERASRASPVAAEIAGVRQLLLRHADKNVNGVSGIRLSDGAVLWSAPLPEGFVLESPLALPGDRVLFTTVNEGRLLRITREGDAWRATTLWDSKDLQSGIGPPVFHDGHIFGFAGDFLTCIDAQTGRGSWKEKLYQATLTLVDGHLVVLSSSAGLLRVVEATPAGYREKGRLQIFKPGAQGVAPPSYVAGRIFVRNEEEIAAVAVR